MSEVILEGNTLGEKHRHYNKIIKDVIQNECSLNFNIINYEDSDINNLIKIDTASHHRNIDYIIKVLKCEDMLYVSRAIKKCPWLVTDEQYADIINPQYLHDQLFPEMTKKATTKFMLYVRLHLKDPLRVEEFFKYYENIDTKIADKWLPNCSVPFIEAMVKKRPQIMRNSDLMRRLCEKSISVLEIFDCSKDICDKKFVIKTSVFLLKTDTERYLSMLEALPDDFRRYLTSCDPKFNKRTTNWLMKKCPERIINNFVKYRKIVHMPTFAKYVNNNKIKEFLINLAKIKSPFVKRWLKIEKIKHFIKRIPDAERFQFVKEVFIDNDYPEKDDIICLDSESYQYGLKMLRDAVIDNDQQLINKFYWYQFAPFDVAFDFLKKSLIAEASPEKRTAILEILLTCAGKNMQHIKTVLDYYNVTHVKDQLESKKLFVNKVLSCKDVYNFDKTTWEYIDNIFKSIDVYEDSDNYKGEDIINAVVVYKVINDELVPEIIEKKFVLNPLNVFCRKLTLDKKEKVFSYLYNIMLSKINEQKVSTETEFQEVIQMTKQALEILKVWKKDLINYDFFINKIRVLIQLKNDNSWSETLSPLYNSNKSWRKYLFEESIVLSPSQDTCINALKHDSTMLLRFNTEIENIRNDSKMSLLMFLRKLRIYWSHSIATEWIKSYNETLTSVIAHKPVTLGLCTLLPTYKLMNIITKYAPTCPKVKWDVIDEIELSLQRNFAKNMHFARPLLSPDAILSYAMGDYLQYSLPSLHAVFYNLSVTHSREYIPKLWDAPVSLQKHGIRFAFTKLTTVELKTAFARIWRTSKNSTIRVVIFELTHNLLCREKNEIKTKELWELLEVFIDNLSFEEDRKLYDLLSKVDNIPKSVRAQYMMKSYNFLKKLLLTVKEGEKEKCSNQLIHLSFCMRDVIESMDPTFVENLIFEFINTEYIKKKITYRYKFMCGLISSYVLCTKDEENQRKKYITVITPIMKQSFDLWDSLEDKTYYIRKNFCDLLSALQNDLKHYVVENNMIVPTKIYQDIQIEIEKLPIEENYLMIRKWYLTVAMTKIIEKLLTEHKISERLGDVDDNDLDSKKNIWNELCIEGAPEFSNECLNILKRDVEVYFPCIYVLFARVLESNKGLFSYTVWRKIYELLLQDTDYTYSYLTVIQLMPPYHHYDENKDKIKHIHDLVLAHPKIEVKIHYYDKFKQDGTTV